MRVFTVLKMFLLGFVCSVKSWLVMFIVRCVGVLFIVQIASKVSFFFHILLFLFLFLFFFISYLVIGIFFFSFQDNFPLSKCILDTLNIPWLGYGERRACEKVVLCIISFFAKRALCFFNTKVMFHFDHMASPSE